MPSINDDLQIDIEDTKAFITNVLKNLKEKCDLEAVNGCLSIPLENKSARIEHYTGLSNYLVQSLIEDIPERTTLNLESRILIYDTVRKLYAGRKSFHFNTIYGETFEKLNDQVGKAVVDNCEFLKQMQILGYISKKTTLNNEVVVENPKSRFERYMYLQKLKNFRSNNEQWQIVYIDVRYIDLNLQFDKPKQSNLTLDTSLNMNKNVFYHAVSKNGLLTGMFCNQDNFKKWVTDVLLVCLKCPSVIIMDGVHSQVRNNKPMTRNHSKSEMLRWLTNNNIPCNSNMSKPVLYELISKYYQESTEYQIDKILHSQGHEILRLPQQLYDLSITTILWKNLKKEYFGETPTVKSLQDMLMKVINLMPTSEWIEYEKEIEKYETQIFEIDTAVENFTDMFNIEI